MVMGDRLRSIREARKLSQGDIEKRAGLLRCYVSRVECGHTVPSVETLEKWAAALQIPVYAIFYDGAKPAYSTTLKTKTSAHEFTWGSSGSQLPKFSKLRSHLSKMTEHNRQLLLSLANKMVSGKRRHRAKTA